jgi:hypothetical protein
VSILFIKKYSIVFSALFIALNILKNADIYKIVEFPFTILNFIVLFFFLVEKLINKLNLKTSNSLPNYFLPIILLYSVNSIGIYKVGFFQYDLKNIAITIIINLSFFLSWSFYKAGTEIKSIHFISLLFATMTNLNLTFEKDARMLAVGWSLIAATNIFLASRMKNTNPLFISIAAMLSIIYQIGGSNFYVIDILYVIVAMSINSLIGYAISKDHKWFLAPLFGLGIAITAINLIHSSSNLIIIFSILILLLLNLLFITLLKKMKREFFHYSLVITTLIIIIQISIFEPKITLVLIPLTLYLLIRKKDLLEKKVLNYYLQLK